MSELGRPTRNEVGVGLILGGLMGFDALFGTGVTRTLVDGGEGLIQVGQDAEAWVSDHVGGDAESDALGPVVTVNQVEVTEIPSA